MKVYLIDQKNKFFKIKKFLNQKGIEDVEKKENEKIRMTKNDFIIIADSEKIEDLEKYKNMILLLEVENQKQIWKLAQNTAVIDLIRKDMEIDKIALRIYEQIQRQGNKEVEE